jgi:TonB family protein
MNQNHFVSLFVSIFLHLILIIGITGSFSFQISSLSSINNLTPIVVYAMYETKKQDVVKLQTSKINLPTESISLEKGSRDKSPIRIEDPFFSLKNLELKELKNIVPLGYEKGYLNDINKYSNIIKAQVINKWKQPASSEVGISAELSISMLPSGEIIAVKVNKKSGNNAFDQSAIAAVMSLGILRGVEEIPRKMFDDNFRNFSLIFIPKK